MGSPLPGWTTQHVSAVDGVVLGGMGALHEELVRFSPFISRLGMLIHRILDQS